MEHHHRQENVQWKERCIIYHPFTFRKKTPTCIHVHICVNENRSQIVPTANDDVMVIS